LGGLRRKIEITLLPDDPIINARAQAQLAR
jgi:hypothetical protein